LSVKNDINYGGKIDNPYMPTNLICSINTEPQRWNGWRN